MASRNLSAAPRTMHARRALAAAGALVALAGCSSPESASGPFESCSVPVLTPAERKAGYRREKRAIRLQNAASGPRRQRLTESPRLRRARRAWLADFRADATAAAEQVFAYGKACAGSDYVTARLSRSPRTGIEVEVDMSDHAAAHRRELERRFPFPETLEVGAVDHSRAQLRATLRKLTREIAGGFFRRRGIRTGTPKVHLGRDLVILPAEPTTRDTRELIAKRHGDIVWIRDSDNAPARGPG